MGTRNLTMAILDGELKVAQYGQWDGYPIGQGATICKFLQETDIPKFKKTLKKVKFIRDDIEEQDPKLTQEFSRDTGAEILTLIRDRGIKRLIDSSGFAADSLFCEYAYVLNFDTEVLEVYRGFNLSNLEPHDRFFYLREYDKKSDGYEPIKLWKMIPFKDATVESMTYLQKIKSED
jgi:hypothetical protein